uniref:Uncharacterized protein n=1 Tax=Chromera velia CCMP2878 TaxID=1169474 RepID=A0A0G4F5L3_9ALVE|eukprot:Cvel_15218.t1-p1 / transcript=Cvel_15218.t1 / gene=Cvel_15218 / organism=Chromera_velia_CCMP2878 / gene_product=hypothetical protein / transcript_product=hypothetical protein / location=Cvel_scaffold1113:35741-36879(-) / protein_length=116 / sequence_SO=supercontig / SO=protein_coding / is_pseudo=false
MVEGPVRGAGGDSKVWPWGEQSSSSFLPLPPESKISELVGVSRLRRPRTFGASVQSLLWCFVVLLSLSSGFAPGQAPHPHDTLQAAFDLSDRFSPALSEGIETTSVEGNWERATGS